MMECDNFSRKIPEFSALRAEPDLNHYG